MSFNPNALSAPHGIIPTKLYPEAPIITPEMFGAVGDGVTDDTAAFVSAFGYLAANRPGPLVLGFKDYAVNTGPVVIPFGCGIKGQASLGGVYVSGNNTGIATRILNNSNNDTVTMSNLNNYVEGVVFAAPQPVFQCGITGGGAISGVNARYSGYGLTPGTYNLIFDGGWGTGAAGTCLVGANGQVTSCTVTNGGSGYLGPSGGAGGLALPRVRVVITGGGQTGAHIKLPGGADMWHIEDCGFISKAFGVCCNGGQVITTANGSYAGSNSVIPIANTAGITSLMVVNNITNPLSIRQFNGIATVTANTSITMSYNVDAASTGAADILVIGTPVYFVKGQIKKCSFWGSTYWQIYGNWGAENVDVTDNILIDAESGSVFWGQTLAGTFERNNIDGIFCPTAFPVQFLQPPKSIKNNAIGNVTGSSATTTPAVYISGRLVFGGSIQNSNLLIQGNDLYAPLCRGFWFESVTGATLIGNEVATYDPTKISGCLDIFADSLSVGNRLVFGADAGPNFPSYWSIPSQNWVIGPWGEQEPYVKVSANYIVKSYDRIIAVDATTGGKTITLPSASTGLTSSNAGLQFTVIKIDSSGNAVTTTGDNINGAGTSAVTAQYAATTFTRATTSEWFITGVSP